MKSKCIECLVLTIFFLCLFPVDKDVFPWFPYCVRGPPNAKLYISLFFFPFVFLTDNRTYHFQAEDEQECMM